MRGIYLNVASAGVPEASCKHGAWWGWRCERHGNANLESRSAFSRDCRFARSPRRSVLENRRIERSLSVPASQTIRSTGDIDLLFFKRVRPRIRCLLFLGRQRHIYHLVTAVTDSSVVFRKNYDKIGIFGKAFRTSFHFDRLSWNSPFYLAFGQTFQTQRRYDTAVIDFSNFILFDILRRKYRTSSDSIIVTDSVPNPSRKKVSFDIDKRKRLVRFTERRPKSRNLFLVFATCHQIRNRYTRIDD